MLLQKVFCSGGISYQDKNQKVVLFGASGLGRAYANFLVKNGFWNIYFCDNNLGLPSEIDNITVLEPISIADNHNDAKILITSTFWRDISIQLYELGLGREFTYVQHGERGKFDYHVTSLSMENRFLSAINQFSKCPICQRRGMAHFMHNGTRNLFICKGCGHCYASDFMTKKEFGYAYQGMKYFRQNCSCQGIHSLADDSQWRAFCELRLRTLGGLGINPDSLTGSNVLEIGCLEGRFLHYLKMTLGCNVLGMDVNEEVAQKSMRTLGIKILIRNIETSLDLKDNEFDIVLMFHLLEHVKSPLEVLKKTYRCLKNGGSVVVEVPDGKTEPYTPDHYHFFSKDSLKRSLENLFSDVKIYKGDYRDAAGIVRSSLRASASKQSA